MASVTYVAKREIEKTGFAKTLTDIFAQASDDSFGSVSTVFAGLLQDQWVQTSGLARGGNSGWFQVKSASLGPNLIKSSEQMDDVAWSKSNITVTANNTNDPNGNLTADKIAATASAVTNFRQTVANFPGNQLTYSLYIKKGSGALDANVYGIFDDTLNTAMLFVSVNFDTQAISYSGAYLTGASLQSAANGWFRLALTIPAIAGHQYGCYVCFSGGSETAGEFSFAWGAQVEAASSASAYVATTTSAATPGKIFTLTPPISHIRLPGVVGNNAQTPDSQANSITGPIEIMAKASLVDWTPAGASTFICKDDGVSNRDYDFLMQAGSTGCLQFVYSTDGSTARTATSSAAVPFVDGQIGWVKVTYDTATGNVKFFTSTDGQVFTQLGSTQVITAGAIHDGSGALIIGQTTFPNQPLLGRIYYAEIRSGIGGTIMAAFDPTRATRGASTFQAQTGETWTINSSGTPPAMLQGPLVVDEGAEYLACAPGAATTPDSAAGSVTGPIELMAKALMPDWTPAASFAFVGKDDGGSNRDYTFYLDSAGKLNFLYTTDGTTIAGRNATSSVAVPFTDGSLWYVKATYNTGSGIVQFFTSPDGLVWTQLGTNITITSGAIHNGTGQLAVGSSGFIGNIYYAEVRNGIGGQIVAAFDPGRAAAGSSSLTAYTGEVWTLAFTSSLVRAGAVTVTGYKRGSGQSYSMDFALSSAERRAQTQRTVNQPLGGGAPEVVLQRHDKFYQVTTSLLTEAQMGQVREFIASVEGGETFTFDPYGTAAAPNSPHPVVLSSESYNEQRADPSGFNYRVSFEVMLLD